MKKIQSVFIPALLGITLIMLSSWGFLVHKTAHQLAVYELPKEIQPFFFKNIDYLVANSIRPDQRRNEDPTEATKHFIDLEAYGDDAALKMPLHWDDAVKKYSKDTLLKYGYVPYHVVFMKEKLTAAFKSNNKDSILFYAADIGHYIEDAHVPLHTSINYDGQLTNQKGLHSLWESTVPGLEINQYQLSSKHKATYLNDPSLAIWTAVRKANTLLKDVFAKETELTKIFTDAEKYRTQTSRGREFKNYTPAFAKAYGEALKNTINEQLISSADLVADFWYTAWVDAGKPDLSGLFSLNDEDKAALRKGQNSFQNNTLIRDSLLMSLKGSRVE